MEEDAVSEEQPVTEQPIANPVTEPPVVATELRDPELTPESAKALADKVIDEHFIPKKVPDVEDDVAQEKAIAGALASSMLTSTDMPLTMLNDYIQPIAKQMRAYGIRQTKHVDREAAHVPHWITDGVRQNTMKVPEQPAHTEDAPVEARTAEAPKPPARIKKAARAVRLEPQ